MVANKKVNRKRFREMKETAADIAADIREEMFCLQEVALSMSGYSSPTFIRLIFDLLDKRTQAISLRAYYMRKVSAYYWCELKEEQKNDWEFPIMKKLLKVQIPLIFEIIIIIQYLHNQVFDGKNGVFTKEDIRNNVIAANKLKDILFEYIDRKVPLYDHEKEELIFVVRKIFTYVDDGQRIESQFNTYKAFKYQSREKYEGILKERVPEEIKHYLASYKSIIKKARPFISGKNYAFLSMYLYRIFLTNTSLFVYGAKWLGRIMKAPQDAIDKMCHFSVGYGLMLQIVNDNSDFIYKILGKEGEIGRPPVGKKPSDALSDLKNRNITLPILIHLERREKQAKRDLITHLLSVQAKDIKKTNDGKHELIIYPILVLKDIMATQAIDTSIKIGRNFCEHLLGILSPGNPNTEYFIDMAAIGNWNKYYYSLEKFRQKFKREGFKFERRELVPVIFGLIFDKLKNKAKRKKNKEQMEFNF